MTVLLFAVYVLFAVGGLTLLKISGLRVRPLTAVALFCYGISFLLWMLIVNRMPLSTAMPINVGLVNLGTLLVSALWLRERITLPQWFGAAIIMLGVALVSRGGKLT